MYTQKPLSYAPTPYSYTPNTALSATINLDEVCALFLCFAVACMHSLTDKENILRRRSSCHRRPPRGTCTNP